ncbi:hypothetical protein BDW71DRAFT_185739 [Aspergillus fruticulosus]
MLEQTRHPRRLHSRASLADRCPWLYTWLGRDSKRTRPWTGSSSSGCNLPWPASLPVADPSGKTDGNPNVTATPQVVTVLAARTSTTNVNASVVIFNHSTITDINSNLSLETFNYYPFVLGNLLPLAPEILAAPLCLRTIQTSCLCSS